MKVKLEDVCERGSSSIKQSDIIELTGEYPIFGAAGYIGNIDFYQQEKPYVAVVKDGAGIGRTTLHPAKSSVIGTMQYLLPKENVLPEYLYYVVRYMHLEKYFTGATIPHIYFKDYKNEQFNLDSLDEQKQIVIILGKCEKIISDRQSELAELDKLIKARFIEMFGSPESDEKYPQIAIKDFTEVISGGTPDRKNNEYWENGIVPWVKTTELQNNHINVVEECITEKGLNESSAKVVPKNTVLIAMYGQGKTRGMTAILGIPASTNQACACILPCEKVEPKYLWQYMIMSYDRLRNLAQGGNQPNLNGNMIKNFTVLVPPRELQLQYV